MENASKALIIAGAILIAILLISVGILVMNSTGSVTDEVGKTADTMALQTFNSQFTTYEGTNMTASQVKSLMGLIKSSNASNGVSKATDTFTTVKTTDKYVYLESTGATGETVITATSKLEKNKTYTVEVTGYSTNGYVQKIKITRN